jgi:hypothetical protein
MAEGGRDAKVQGAHREMASSEIRRCSATEMLGQRDANKEAARRIGSKTQRVQDAWSAEGMQRCKEHTVK